MDEHSEHPIPQILKDLLLERERAEADAKIDKLLTGGRIRRRDFWTWGLCERLLEKSWELRQKDPSRMVDLAQHAVEVAQRIDPEKYGAQNMADLLARSWAGLANAYRISDQLALADSAFSQAFEAHREGTGTPIFQARLAELFASLLCDQRKFPDALQVLDLAYSLYLDHKALHDAGRALVKKGLQTGYTGDPEEGIQLLARGLKLLDRDRDPKLVFQCLHNILLFRVERGEFKSARRQIWEMRPLYDMHEDPIARVKLRWIEGKVFFGLGEFDRASRAFQQAKEGFLERRLYYDAALISFDLAAVWLRQGKREDVRWLLREMLQIFRARYVAREAVATFVMLRDAADRNELTPQLLENASVLFEILKDDPKNEAEVRSAD
jgi:tetratricopeptide (TPR) repeat protein